MYATDSIYAASMTDQQRAWFAAEYQRARKDEVLGVILAVFLGDFGVHHFYLRRDGLGVLYLLFFWTGIPAIIAIFEAFFMPGRVRRYNTMQAIYISTQILAVSRNVSASHSPASVRCTACGNVVDSTAIFCNHCGSAVDHSGLSTQPAL